MSEEKENNTKVMDNKKTKNADADKNLKNKKESKKEKKLDSKKNNNAEENLNNDDFSENKDQEPNLEEEIQQLREEKLRLLAEMENLRKRSDRDRIDSIKYGSINLARDILTPDDNLTRALEAIPQEEKNSETIKNLIDGLKMVQREFSTILEKHGVKKIDALNKKFDHNFHQAMVEIENDEVEDGIVIQEMQSGYIMHDRLLRPSMVGVSKKSSRSKDDNNTNEEKE